MPVFTDGRSAWKFVSSIHPHMRATNAGRHLTRRKFIALLGSAPSWRTGQGVDTGVAVTEV